MKQENVMASTSRFRASPRAKEFPKPESSPSPGLKLRPKSVPPDLKANSTRTKRTLLVNKPKSGDDNMGSQKGREGVENKAVGRLGNRPVVEQYAKPRRLRPVENGTKRSDGVGDNDVKRKELQEKLEQSETLVKNLQSELEALKAELENTKSEKAELQGENKKLADDLAAAQARIAALSISDQESCEVYKSTKFKDIRKLISNKLDQKVTKEASSEGSMTKNMQPSIPMRQISISADTQRRVPASTSLAPPPPPPPLPPRVPKNLSVAQKAPGVVEFYQSLRKQEGKKDGTVLGNRGKSATLSAHSSIVGEIQNRSAHLLAIKADIETKADFVNDLIQKVQAAAYMDIEHVLKFVDWLDGELSSLADEQAVLKHFKWPERKADAMREAAVEYRELKLLECEISCYVDDTDIPCGVALKKMASLLDKTERGIQRLVKLRNSSMRLYEDFHIPTDWMLDSGIVTKIKQASMKLANMYMKRVTMEFELVRNSDRESAQEALLLQGVQFAYRAHQFAGGLDPEALCAFEEIRQRVPGHLRGSRELLAGIPSS